MEPRVYHRLGHTLAEVWNARLILSKRTSCPRAPTCPLDARKAPRQSSQNPTPTRGPTGDLTSLAPHLHATLPRSGPPSPPFRTRILDRNGYLCLPPLWTPSMEAFFKTISFLAAPSVSEPHGPNAKRKLVETLSMRRANPSSGTTGQHFGLRL